MAADLGKGFITNGQSNSVTVFNLKTLEKVGEPAAGAESRFGVLRAEDTARVYVQRPVQQLDRHQRQDQRSDRHVSGGRKAGVLPGG